jgi:hypothetical protein
VTFASIHAEEAKLPTRLLCRALKVSQSGFYAWSKCPPSRRGIENSKLFPVIRACHARVGHDVHLALAGLTLPGRDRGRLLASRGRLGDGRSPAHVRVSAGSSTTQTMALSTRTSSTEPSYPPAASSAA